MSDEKIHDVTKSIRAISNVLYDDLVNSECEEGELLSNNTKEGLFQALEHLADLIDVRMSMKKVHII